MLLDIEKVIEIFNLFYKIPAWGERSFYIINNIFETILELSSENKTNIKIVKNDSVKYLFLKTFRLLQKIVNFILKTLKIQTIIIFQNEKI